MIYIVILLYKNYLFLIEDYKNKVFYQNNQDNFIMILYLLIWKIYLQIFLNLNKKEVMIFLVNKD